MTWATPTLAIVTAAIAVPSLIILYFLKLRRRDVEISTTLLWDPRVASRAPASSPRSIAREKYRK